jgi:hypothetical protein
VTIESCLDSIPLEQRADRDHFGAGLRAALVPDSMDADSLHSRT